MIYLIPIVFGIAYIAIAFEHSLKTNKSAIALIAAGLMWSIYALSSPLGIHPVSEQLTEKLSETAAIVFFLICAMTIVEVIDAHQGFEVITSRIKAKKLSTLLWIVAILSFFLSAILDNMTTAIVMVTLMRKMLKERKHRLFFAGIIVIAANAGGAWSPTGDVTTTMLWIGGQLSTGNIIKSLFVPSLVNMIIPTFIASLFLKGDIVQPENSNEEVLAIASFEKKLMFILGLSALIFVPVFKVITHLPPYLGILLSLGVFWTVGELLHRNKPDNEKDHLSLTKALKKIDMPSVVFFIGILLAVATLSSNGMLQSLAELLNEKIGNQSDIVIAIGLASSVVDNIPLVAASMGMYPLSQYPIDSFLWEFLAYCTGTGGSILIIGSAAGVAAMGLEKITFFWYLRKIAPLALIGYLGGVGAFILQKSLIN